MLTYRPPSPVTLRAPYLIFLGRESNIKLAKTGTGLVEWRREQCVGQLRLSEAAVDMGIPDMTVDEAVAAGVKSLVIGIAPVGGAIEAEWVPYFVSALELGIDIVAGMHTRLGDHEELAKAETLHSGSLIDVRVPPAGLPVGTGKKRSGKRVLMVGTDCAVGKKYTALALAKAMQRQGGKATFRASGQTGIMIAGEGIPLDAVVSDFVSGAAEVLSPPNDADHWDVVEGQGSLFHPGYAGVALGLLHGTQPDALVVCSDPSRTELNTYEGFPIVDLGVCIERNLELARLTNPDVRCVGISLNTSNMDEAQAKACLRDASERFDVSAVDPVRFGADAIATFLLQKPAQAA